MRSNRFAALAVAVGLALLGSASAGVRRIAAAIDATPAPSFEHHHHHDGRRGERGL
jgi:hypothetical protein